MCASARVNTSCTTSATACSSWLQRDRTRRSTRLACAPYSSANARDDPSRVAATSTWSRPPVGSDWTTWVRANLHIRSTGQPTGPMACVSLGGTGLHSARRVVPDCGEHPRGISTDRILIVVTATGHYLDQTQHDPPPG